MKHGLLPAVALACLCLGASRPPSEPPPFFPEDYERRRADGGGTVQKYHEGILITGPDGYIAAIGKALALIEENDGRNWYFVRKHVRRITYTGHSGIDLGGGRFTSGYVRDPVTSAGNIVHDAWHRELYFRGLPWEGREAEAFCLEKQNGFLATLQRPPLDVERAMGSEYWKIDYWKRGW